MARKELTTQQEREIAVVAEEASSAGADVKQVSSRVSRGANPTAVLSVRVPLDQLQALRSIAQRRAMSLSEVVQEALASFASAGGPQVFSSQASWKIYVIEPAASEAYNPPPKGRWLEATATESRIGMMAG